VERSPDAALDLTCHEIDRQSLGEGPPGARHLGGPGTVA
jgi:hypothetical protein